MFQTMIPHGKYDRIRSSVMNRPCVICGTKSIGINFGVLTCAPCKAFFRRNARRKELLKVRCQHHDLGTLFRTDKTHDERIVCYLQIRRCSSCRLHRCFEMGMKEELVRTDQENEKHKQLVDMNRKRRNILKHQIQSIQQLSVPQMPLINTESSEEIDWTHLSNIVFAYDILCLKTFTHQLSTTVFNHNSPLADEQLTNKHPTGLTMSVVLGFSAFIRSLPAFYSLPLFMRNYLCKTNIRPLMLPNIHELNQSCYSEPWQTVVYKSTWEYMCGPELYKLFVQAERLAEQLWINDPVVTRLWFIILFFSTPLHYHSDGLTLTPILKKKQVLLQIQNGYVTLLWKYFIHRHGCMEPTRIFLNLVHVYMKMQTVGFGIYLNLKSVEELKFTNEILTKLVIMQTNQE